MTSPDPTAYVLLEDGERFDGLACGAETHAVGEVVFTTGMTGYQEAVTDPSFAGQLIAFTTAHVGNYGVSAEAMESDRIHARAAIMRAATNREDAPGAEGGWLDWLRERGATVELHPCTSSAEQLLARDPDAFFLANGPGDPAALGYVVETVRGLVGKRPVYGICLGHQLLCRAVGLETYKLPFGHRGSNHPVKDLTTGRVEITSQNHGFAVLGPGGAKTLPTDEPVRWETDFGAAELTHINLYDRTVEGLALRDVPGATVQYHPEAGPGPHDALYLFDRFLEEIAAHA